MGEAKKYKIIIIIIKRKEKRLHLPPSSNNILTTSPDTSDWKRNHELINKMYPHKVTERKTNR